MWRAYALRKPSARSARFNERCVAGPRVLVAAGMNLRNIVGALIGATLISGIVWAGAGVQPGKYQAKGASGTLVVVAAKSGALSFAIESTGSNGHTCSINGEIPAGANSALVPTGEGEKPCIVVFHKVTAGISVETPDTDSCQYFCGARASFDLAYDKVDGKCWPKAVRGQRAEFRRAYEKKDFATARDRLDGALKNCKDYIDEFERYRTHPTPAPRGFAAPVAQLGPARPPPQKTGGGDDWLN